MRELRGRGVEDVLAVDEADSGRADGAVERQAGDFQGRGCADEGRDVGVDLRVDGQHRGDDLHFVHVAGREQRANRAVDEAAGQHRVFGRPALALEEAAGDFARGVGALLVFHGQREKRQMPLFAAADHGDHDHRVAHTDDHGGVGLAGDGAGLDAHFVLAIWKGFDDFIHSILRVSCGDRRAARRLSGGAARFGRSGWMDGMCGSRNCGIALRRAPR